jgi:hypothetical protein
MLLKIIARIECMRFILAANINYITCKLFSVARVRDLKSDDYFNSLPMGEIMSICSEGDLGNMKKAYPGLAKSLQNAVGSSRFQIRLQFGRRDTISVGIRDNDLGVIGGKGISEGPRTEVVGEASGEWKPCLPAEENPQKPLRNTKRTVNEKDLLQFGGIRLVVTYIPPK